MSVGSKEHRNDNNWRRLVIKVGTSTIVDGKGEIKYPVINRLSQTLTQLQKSGYRSDSSNFWGYWGCLATNRKYRSDQLIFLNNKH